MNYAERVVLTMLLYIIATSPSVLTFHVQTFDCRGTGISGALHLLQLTTLIERTTTILQFTVWCTDGLKSGHVDFTPVARGTVDHCTGVWWRGVKRREIEGSGQNI